MMLLYLFMLTLQCLQILPYGQSALIDGQPLEKELQRIADEALGVSHMQKEYNKLQYNSEPLNGRTIVDSISASLSQRFSRILEALERLKDAVETHYSTSTTSPSIPKCCKASGVHYDTRFRSMINFKEGCVAKSATIDDGALYPPRAVEQVMKENYDSNNYLLWQYFGSEDGTYINYPSVKLSTCDYDPRFRPYYASGVSPKPKDVVITIDTSNSMSTPYGDGVLMQIAKEAAITVVQTLNPNDRVGVVSFNTIAQTPTVKGSSCYSSKLAMAVSKNTDEIIDYINRLSGHDETNYEAGLRASFRYFSQSESSFLEENRERVILFLTDGKEDVGADPLAVIRDENHLLNNSVVILTFGLGKGLSVSALSLLHNMSQQVLNQNQFGEVKKGRFKHITNPSNLRTEMGSYYNLLSKQQSEATFTVPYIDLFSKIGLLTSMCLPAYSNGKFIGVACIDMKLSDLQSDMNYVQDEISSYTFLIDGYGRTMIHPLLPQPRGIQKDIVLIDIFHFEKSLSSTTAIDRMKRGENGDVTVLAVRTLPRGHMVKEGMTSRAIKSHYIWKKVPNSNYTVCVVVGEDDTKDTPNNLPGRKDVFVYHNREFGHIKLNDCKHYARVATKDHTLVMLTTSAFIDPSKYLDQNETETMIYRYEQYFNGNNLKNPGFKDSVLTSVVITYEAEVLWKKTVEESVIWRYIVTADGVLRMYPGVQQLKDWDHKERPWYWRTTSQNGTYVLSAPYEDLWGAGYLITFSHTIYQGSSGLHAATNRVVAVMALDFSIHYFYQMVLQQYQECNMTTYRCFVIDNSGFIVIHPDFTDTFRDPQLDKLIHIVSKEGDIARDLISKGILTKRSCTDFESINDHVTYRVRLTFLYSEGIDMLQEASGYEMRPVKNSNVFLIIKKNTAFSLPCCTQSQYLSPESLKCNPDASKCECLCFRDINFDFCRNEYPSRDASPTCSATSPEYNFVFDDEEKTIQSQRLQSCFDPMCQKRNTSELCYNVAGCSWCVANVTGSQLRPPFCALNDICPFGKCKDASNCKNMAAISTKNNETKIDIDDGELTLKLALGLAVGSAVVIIMLILFIIVVCKIRRSNTDDTYITAIDDSKMVGVDNENFMLANGLVHYIVTRPKPHVQTEESSDNHYDKMPSREPSNESFDPNSGYIVTI